MDRWYISTEAWAEFTKSFPAAQSFLLGKSLEGELRYLERGVNLGVIKDSERPRLNELREWKKRTESYK